MQEPSPYAILRNRNFSFYLIGRFVSAFGSQMLSVAVGWELYERTGSSMALGLVGLTQFLPMVLATLPAGHVADTRNRKHVIIAMQVLLACTSLGLTGISVFKGNVFFVYCCLFAAGLARTFMWSASASFLPQLVAPTDFARAVTWSTSTFQFSAVAGPASAGAIIAWRHSAAPIYALNAIAAITCFILLLFVKVTPRERSKQQFTLEWLLGGFSFVFNTPIVLGIITLDMFAVLFGGATALLPVYAKDILHVGARGLGVLEAALPVGSLVCALYFAHRPPLRKAGRALLVAVIGFGLATIGFGLSTSYPLSWAMLFLCGFADNISVIVRHTLVQLLTPDEMRGRVSAVNNLFIGTSNELGGFESGFVSHYFGPIVSVVTGGIATIITVVAVATAWPQIRKFGRLEPPQ